MTELKTLRNEKDDFFRSERQSPLSAEQKQAFNGLNYFPENNALRLELKLERTTSSEPFGFKWRLVKSPGCAGSVRFCSDCKLL